MTITKPKFAEVPKDYAGLVALYPRGPHDQRHAVGVGQRVTLAPRFTSPSRSKSMTAPIADSRSAASQAKLRAKRRPCVPS
jgi:hypothetical protein